jgi:hypothetical protein
VDNPVPGGRCVISAKAANRHVSRGTARWTLQGKRIRFVEDSPARLAMNSGYDRFSRSGIARVADIRNLPVVTPARLIQLQTRRGNGNRAAFKGGSDPTAPNSLSALSSKSYTDVEGMNK